MKRTDDLLTVIHLRRAFRCPPHWRSLRSQSALLPDLPACRASPCYSGLQMIPARAREEMPVSFCHIVTLQVRGNHQFGKLKSLVSFPTSYNWSGAFLACVIDAPGERPFFRSRDSPPIDQFLVPFRSDLIPFFLTFQAKSPISENTKNPARL